MKLISIFKIKRQKKDIYHAEFEHNEKVHRISLKKSTKDEAVKEWNNYLKKFEDQKEKLRFEEKLFSTTIENGIDEFIAFRNKNVQSSSFTRDLRLINKFRDFLIKNQIDVVKNIDDSIIEKFLNNYEDNSPKTYNNVLGLLSVIIEYFKSKNYLPKHFILDKKNLRKKKPISKIEIINKDEAKIVIEYFKAIDNLGEKVYLLLPFYCGMRASEIKGLNRKNINFQEKKITVSEKQTDSDDSPIKMLKSKSGYRVTPILNDDFIKLFKQYIDENKQDYPFQNYYSNKIKHHYKKIKNLHNIHYHFHASRHYFASSLVEAGINIKLVQKILGHSSITMTLDLYSHILKDFDSDTFKDVII